MDIFRDGIEIILDTRDINKENREKEVENKLNYIINYEMEKNKDTYKLLRLTKLYEDITSCIKEAFVLLDSINIKKEITCVKSEHMLIFFDRGILKILYIHKEKAYLSEIKIMNKEKFSEFSKLKSKKEIINFSKNLPSIRKGKTNNEKEIFWSSKRASSN